jgi:hypothetical protein
MNIDRLFELAGIKHHELYEMPQRIPPLDTDGMKQYSNEYLKYFHDPSFTITKLFNIDDTTIMYHLDSPSKGGYAAITNDGIFEKCIFVMEYQNNSKKFGPHIVEKLVWASPDHRNILKNIPIKMFFDYIIPNHKIIVCDHSYTDDGERFFKNKIIPLAFDKKLNVYLMITRPIMSVTKIDTLVDFQKLDDGDIWSPDRHINPSNYTDKRFIISTTPLNV